jgi:hypothetical protein
MTATGILTGVISVGFSAAVFAQAVPAPAPAPAAATGVVGSQAATSQGATEEEKRAARGRSVDEQVTSGQRRSNNPGYVAPMNIKIQETGIALPKCTAESREGEACRQ